MRILRVIASMDPATGGPCQGIRYSIPHLQAEGCTNEVVCLDDPASLFLGGDPFAIHALGRGRGPLRYHPDLLPWLEEHLTSYDAVIVHGLWLWPSIATRMATQRLQKKRQHLSASSPSQLPAPKIPPYFVMPHGMLDPWFQRDKNRKLKALRNSIYWHLIEKKVIRDAEGVLFTCEQELLLAKISFSDYRPKRAINVGYGVPNPPSHSEVMEQAFHQQSPALTKDHPCLLFLSRIHPKKGVDLLIHAYAEVFGDRLTGKFEKPADTPHQIPALVIAGPIDSDYAGEMIRLAESLLPGGVFTSRLSSDHQSPIHDSSLMNRPSIHFTGILQGDSKWGALYRCEAFVLPSHQENFGIAVVEAMACGKPVIVSDKVNIYRDLVSEGAGFSEADTYEGVVRLLARWKDTSSQLRHHMSASAASCFQKLFKSSSAAKTLIKTVKISCPISS